MYLNTKITLPVVEGFGKTVKRKACATEDDLDQGNECDVHVWNEEPISESGARENRQYATEDEIYFLKKNMSKLYLQYWPMSARI